MTAVTVGRRHALLATAKFLGGQLVLPRASLSSSAAACAFAPVAVARASSPESVDALLVRIAKARAGLKSLAGSFTQERTIGLLASRIRSQGTLTFLAPDRLRWELGPPDDIVYWILGDGLAYRSRSGQGRMPRPSGTAAAGLDDLRTVLGGDLTPLKERYTFRMIDESAAPATLSPTAGAASATPTPTPTPMKAGSDVALEAVPKSATGRPDGGAGTNRQAGAPTRIAFGLAADLVRPRWVRLDFGPKDKTDIAFGDIVRDAAVNASAFELGF